jgi:inorganic phosphate transporter, PiT family
MMLLFLATCFLAYANGANDNFKGVASLFGSRTTSYRTAIAWATVTTLSGSLCAIILAQTLLKKFSGKGLVPDQIAGSEHFLLAVALGAGITVIAATLIGFPVSTTHGLIGAMIGSGLMAAGSHVNFQALGKSFLPPLLLSPVLSVILAAPLYLVLRFLRLRFGIGKEWCVGNGGKVVPIPQPQSVMALRTPSPMELGISAADGVHCEQRYAGRFLGWRSQQIMDAAHFMSAGVVGFARGLNDSPKIAAMLLVVKAVDIQWGTVAVAVAMAMAGCSTRKRSPRR